MEVYNLDPQTRKQYGLMGREWAIGDEAGFTSEHMANRIIGNINTLLTYWKPRKRYQLIKTSAKKLKYTPHKLEY